MLLTSDPAEMLWSGLQSLLQRIEHEFNPTTETQNKLRNSRHDCYSLISGLRLYGYMDIFQHLKALYDINGEKCPKSLNHW